MKRVILLTILAAVCMSLVVGKRKQKEGSIGRLRHGAGDAFEDVEKRITELRDQAKRLSGEARQRLQDQAHDLEGQQRDLRNRMNDLRGEAQKLLERTRSRAQDANEDEADED